MDNDGDVDDVDDYIITIMNIIKNGLNVCAPEANQRIANYIWYDDDHNQKTWDFLRFSIIDFHFISFDITEAFSLKKQNFKKIEYKKTFHGTKFKVFSGNVIYGCLKF